MSRYWNEGLNNTEDDTLEHFGVLGMKWGIRRYQNKDGSLTPAGKRKYKISSEGKLVKRSRAELKSYDKKVTAVKKANEAKKRKAKIREKGLDKNDLDAISNNLDMFSTKEINDAVLRNQAIIKLQDERRDNASEAKKWIDTSIAYGMTLKNAYKLISSDEMQGVISLLNDKYGTNIPLMPNSYENYQKIKGKEKGTGKNG